MKTIELDMTLNQRQEYPSPGQCIYCGDASAVLTDEHITPYAIGGNGVIFRKASCKPCARTINDGFEQYVLRTLWGPFRRRIHAPSRKKPKAETRTLVFKLMDDFGDEGAERVTLEVPIEKVPLHVPLWTLPLPGIMTGEQPSSEIKGRAWTRLRSKEGDTYIAEVKAMTSHPGPIGLHVADVDAAKLLRFLIKTAHAHAIAELGLDAFTPFAPDLILGRSDHYCHFVGCSGEVSEPLQTDKVIELGHGSYRGIETSLVIVRMRVFGFYGTPEYYVVVGERPSTPEEAAGARAAPEGSWGSLRSQA